MPKIKEIIEWLEVKGYDYIRQKKINDNQIIDKPQIDNIAKINNIAFTKKSSSGEAGIIFCKTKYSCINSFIVVKTANPRLDFIKCITRFFPTKPCKIIKGKNIFIGENCSIGNDGFGVEKDDDGSWVKFPHYGNVILEDNVEISNNVCIDRGVLGDTIIRKGVKIDNLVHIAHNVIIDEHSCIVANAMIAGSVKIGKNCWIGPSSSIRNGVTVGNNVLVGIGSNVVKDIPDNVIVAGNPAKIIRPNNKI